MDLTSTPTHETFSIPLYVSGERVVCTFPCIGEDLTGPYFQCAEVITTDDALGPRQTFTVRRWSPGLQAEESFVQREYATFPAAIREARKRCGWG